MRWVLLAVTTLGLSGAHVIAANGVELTAPAGWARVPSAGDGPVTDPRTLLVVGTAGVRPRASRCQIAAYRVPPSGAVVVIVGWKGANGDSGPGRKSLARLASVRRPSFECFGGRGAAATLVLRGREYQVNVMVGERASRHRVEEALAVGRSFDVRP
jgi:hypothetical protein